MKVYGAKDLVLIIGLCGYWAWNVVDRGGFLAYSSFSAGIDPAFVTGVAFFLTLLILLLLPLLRKGKAWSVFRGCFAALAVLGASITIYARFTQDSFETAYALTIVMAALRSGTMIVWFAWLISFNKKGLTKKLTKTVLVLSLMLLLYLALPGLLSFFVYIGFILASGLAMLALPPLGLSSQGEITIKPKYSTIALVAFCFIRIFLGFIIGFTGSISTNYPAPKFSLSQNVAAGILALTIIGALYFCPKKKRERVLNNDAFVISLPLIICLAIYLPLAFDIASSQRVFTALLWVEMIFASTLYFYLNIGLKDLATLTLVAIGSVLSAIGTFIGNSLLQWLGLKTHAGNAADSILPSIPFISLLLFLLLSVFLFAFVLSAKTPKAPKETTVNLFDFAKKYNLTQRETEVLILLAEGYSRPYISERLFISLSTVKTHSEHLYRKIGINKRDELLALVDEVNLKASNQ